MTREIKLIAEAFNIKLEDDSIQSIADRVVDDATRFANDVSHQRHIYKRFVDFMMGRLCINLTVSKPRKRICRFIHCIFSLAQTR